MRKPTLSKYVIPVLVVLQVVSLTGFLKGQVIKEGFDKLTISENFDSISSYWTTLANAENLFIVQDGEYILQRRAASAPYAIIADFESEFSDFRVVTSMKIDKSMGENASIGILFMMQPEGQGGFLVEINKKKEYRLRQIVSGSYRYITGSQKDGGWVRSTAINEPNFSNMIEVKCFNKNYDLYANGSFLRSFSEPAYAKGRMGLIIGPDSRGKVDFMYVFTKATPKEKEAANTGGSKGSDASHSDANIIELAESIINLKTQINKLQEENHDLKKTISAMQTGEQDKDVMIRNHEKQVKNLQDQVKNKETEIDSLKKVNTELLKYKELVGGNDNGDLIINLSKALKSEKEKNQKLESEIRELRSKSGSTSPAPGKGNDKQEKKPAETENSEEKDSNIFLLPKN